MKKRYKIPCAIKITARYKQYYRKKLVIMYSYKRKRYILYMKERFNLYIGTFYARIPAHYWDLFWNRITNF